MAEKSIFWSTGALGDGLNPYTQAELMLWLDRTFGKGIARGYTNELEGTAAAPNVNINTGAAQVWLPYESDASVAVNIPTPVGATRIDRIVLRMVWATATVRIYRIAGVEGAGVPPAITQAYGATYDWPLYQVSITTGGAITLTDERTWLKGHFEAPPMVGTLQRIFTTLGGSDGHRPLDPITGVADERWHWCNGDVVNGFTTPDTRDKLAMSAGPTYAHGATGGAATKDLSHTHAVGTYAAANESAHTHGIGSYAAANESAHTHGVGTFADTAAQAGLHNHTIAAEANVGQADGGAVFWVPDGNHDHGGLTGSTNPAAHQHGITGTSAAGSAHTHSLSGTSAAGSAHTHALAGASASAGSAVQDVMNPYFSVYEFCYVGV